MTEPSTTQQMTAQIEEMQRALNGLVGNGQRIGQLCNVAWAKQEENGTPDEKMVRAIHALRYKQNKIGETVWEIQEVLNDCLIVVDAMEGLEK